MKSKAATVKDYLATLPEDRREAMEALRKVILKNLDSGFQEGMQYGMIGYYVPLSLFPAGYHCDPEQPLTYAGLASQKNHMSVYLMCVYGSPEHAAWFRDAWAKSGKKLDMGKSCVRFKKVEDLALDVIGEAVGRVTAKAYVEQYERTLRTMSKSATARAAKGGTAAKSGKAKPSSARKSKKKSATNVR